MRFRRSRRWRAETVLGGSRENVRPTRQLMTKRRSEACLNATWDDCGRLAGSRRNSRPSVPAEADAPPSMMEFATIGGATGPDEAALAPQSFDRPGRVRNCLHLHELSARGTGGTPPPPPARPADPNRRQESAPSRPRTWAPRREDGNPDDCAAPSENGHAWSGEGVPSTQLIGRRSDSVITIRRQIASLFSPLDDTATWHLVANIAVASGRHMPRSWPPLAARDRRDLAVEPPSCTIGPLSRALPRPCAACAAKDT